MHKNVPDDKKLSLPKYCTLISPVVQFLNMLSIEDLFDPLIIKEVSDDVVTEC